MTIAYWTVLVAALMPIAFAGLAKAGGAGFDNRQPRVWLAQLDGWRQRAHAAQQNSHEAIAPFAAAVIIAHQLDAPQAAVDGLAVAFIVLRVLYGALYIADRDVLRSLVWLAGLACIVALFVVAA